MSSLEWSEAWHYRAYSNQENHELPRTHWELWPVGMDKNAWYNLPIATIERISQRRYELHMEADVNPRYFTTLKAAKAMGIALYRMDNDG